MNAENGWLTGIEGHSNKLIHTDIGQKFLAYIKEKVPFMSFVQTPVFEIY